MMKSMLLAICGLVLCFSRMAFAKDEMPVIDQRQANQETRIDQGIAVANGMNGKRIDGRSNRSISKGW